MRCTKANRKCDYVTGEYARLGKKFVVYTPPMAITSSPDLAQPEKRALHYFRSHVAFEMGAPFGSDLWRDCVYRLADQHEFLMSALVALSSIHASFGPRAAVPHQLEAEALQHYGKAIKKISECDEAELSLEALLVTIVVFFSFESLRGYYQRALQHVEAGLKIIGERLELSNNQSRSSLHLAICNAFLALQNQAREWSTATVPSPFKPENGFEPPLVNDFGSWAEAHLHFEIIYNEGYRLWDYVSLLQERHTDLGEVFVEKIQPRFTALVTRLANWKIGIEKLERSSKADTASRLLLKVYEAYYTAMCEGFLTATCFDSYNANVDRALQFAEQFLESEQRDSEGRRSFSLASRIIPVLFLLLSKSNYPPVRGKCLKLLRLAERREGLWDAKIALQVAQRIIDFKERLGGTEEQPRAHVGIAGQVYESETTCRVTYVVVRNEVPHESRKFMPLEGAVGEWRQTEYISITSA
jgi:hypothetical protein